MIKSPSKQADSIGFRPKRFWSIAEAVAQDDAYGIALDGRATKTPQGHTVVLPSRTLAEAVAAEWASVAEFVDYEAMPLTRLGFAAIDRMPVQQAEILAEATRYAETDLLCYPSDYPDALIAREDAAWLPLLDWASTDLGLYFIQNRSLIHQPQPPETLTKLQALVAAMTPYEQAGVMKGVALFGSVILALAVAHGQLSGEAALAASRIGEDFQAETWGQDAEAQQRTQHLKTDAVNLELWFKALLSAAPTA